jgi:hypothetical protein
MTIATRRGHTAEMAGMRVRTVDDMVFFSYPSRQSSDGVDVVLLYERRHPEPHPLYKPALREITIPNVKPGSQKGSIPARKDQRGKVLLDHPGGKHCCQDRHECETHDEDGIGDFLIEDPALAASNRGIGKETGAQEKKNGYDGQFIDVR